MHNPRGRILTRSARQLACRASCRNITAVELPADTIVPLRSAVIRLTWEQVHQCCPVTVSGKAVARPGVPKGLSDSWVGAVRSSAQHKTTGMPIARLSAAQPYPGGCRMREQSLFVHFVQPFLLTFCGPHCWCGLNWTLVEMSWENPIHR